MAFPGWGYGHGNNWGYGNWGHVDHSWAYGPGYRPAYWHYHGDWYHGCWSGNGWNWGNYALGVTSGWLTSWAFGSRIYDWGYTSYVNPYVVTNPVQVTVIDRTRPVVENNVTVEVPYNYSQPINTEAPPPPEEQATTGVQALDEARNAFYGNDYPQALDLANRALTGMPNDPAVHEFRALVQFALGRYDDAAQAIYAVLSVGPGWDWTTMIGLYPSRETYASQLVALEDHVSRQPEHSAARFLLAYHYLTISETEPAIEQLEEVVRMKPHDRLAAQILSMLKSAQAEETSTGPRETSGEAEAQRVPTPPVPAGPPIDVGKLNGSWAASPSKDVTISLALRPDSTFEWDVTQNNQVHKISGKFAVQDNVLTLTQDQGAAMVGTVEMQNGAFHFRALGAPQSDPGLNFQAA